MRAKFGASNGLSSSGKMAGIGSNPNYNPDAQGGAGVGGVDLSEAGQRAYSIFSSSIALIGETVSKVRGCDSVWCFLCERAARPSATALPSLYSWCLIGVIYADRAVLRQLKRQRRRRGGAQQDLVTAERRGGRPVEVRHRRHRRHRQHHHRWVCLPYYDSFRAGRG